MTIQWKRSAKVEGYESADGRWVIERQESYSTCENPHPQGKGKPYCEGYQEHPYTVWVLWDDLRGWETDRIDAGDTLREMKASAENLA